jgi:hypothetical protein
LAGVWPRERTRLSLAEADRQRKERRATQPGEAEREDAESRLVLGEERDDGEVLAAGKVTSAMPCTTPAA